MGVHICHLVTWCGTDIAFWPCMSQSMVLIMVSIFLVTIHATIGLDATETETVTTTRGTMVEDIKGPRGGTTTTAGAVAVIVTDDD